MISVDTKMRKVLICKNLHRVTSRQSLRLPNPIGNLFQLEFNIIVTNSLLTKYNKYLKSRLKLLHLIIAKR